MKLICASLLVYLLFSGCSGKEPLPKDILPPSKMKSILWDVLRADEMAAFYGTKDSGRARSARHEELYQEIFQIHHITKDEFKKSLQYYEGHPDLLKTVMDSLQKQSDSSARKADTAALRKVAP